MSRFFLLFLILVFIFSCRKETDIINSAGGNFVSFSTDTLLFDTIFTTVGSTTRYLKVYNNYNSDISIHSIALAKGENSSFQLNIDGESNHTIQNTLLRSGDSLYIFAEVTIDPNGLNSPFIETDSIIFTYDNKIQDVDLVAWGRDAYFHCGIPDYQQYFSNNLDSMLYSDFFSSIPDNLIGEQFHYYSIKEYTQWTNEKPHVIYGDVIVENSAILEIQEGAEIYLHNDAWLVIDSLSSLHSLGTLGDDNVIIFQSDRLDNHSLIDYANTPGQWGKIWFLPGSVNNLLEYTILKNGKIGIHIDGKNDMNNLPNNPVLSIKNSIIYNMSSIGILAQGSKVYAENMLVANCGQHLLALNIGGFYDFKHCTFVNFWPFSSRQTPSIFLNNYYEDVNGNIQYRDLIQANFGNCIIDGTNENELFFDKSEKATFNYILDHCVLKLNSDYWDNWSHKLCDGVILSETAGFIDYEIYDFQLDSNSVSLNVGSQLIAQEVPFDINNISRIKSPDIGCFERVE